ncbi:MAG: hypothetical protein R2865_01720 [Deinococcales bacterium]
MAESDYNSLNPADASNMGDAPADSETLERFLDNLKDRESVLNPFAQTPQMGQSEGQRDPNQEGEEQEAQGIQPNPQQGQEGEDRAGDQGASG